MENCSMCDENIKEINAIFNEAKVDVPENRHYIFDNYYAKKKPKRDICISCYIKTTLLVAGAM